MPNCGDCGKPLSANPGPNDCPSSMTHIPTCVLDRLRAENARLSAEAVGWRRDAERHCDNEQYYRGAADSNRRGAWPRGQDLRRRNHRS